jgi:hypothetical protein
MLTALIHGELDPRRLIVLMDIGHPLLNKVFDSFVNVGKVSAQNRCVCKTAFSSSYLYQVGAFHAVSQDPDVLAST